MDEKQASKKSLIVLLVVLAVVLVVGGIGYSLLSQGASDSTAGIGSAGADPKDAVATAQAEGAVQAEGAAQDAATQSSQEAGAQTSQITLADLDCVVFDAMENAYELSRVADGKPLLVNFWATWCPYCIDEMADLQNAYDTYGTHVSFALLDAVDGTRETVEQGATYMEDNGFEMPVYYDTRQNAITAFGIRAYPTTVLFAADGSVAYAVQGRLSAEDLGAALAAVV